MERLVQQVIASLCFCFLALAQPAAEQERLQALRLADAAAALYQQQEKDAILQAAEKWRQAAAQWRRLGDHRREGEALSLAGRCLHVLGEYRAALEPFAQAAQAFHAIGDRRAEGRCLFEISKLYGVMVEMRERISYYLRAVELWSEINEPELPLIKWLQMGRGYRLTGDWQRAHIQFNQLLHAARVYPHTAQSRYYEREALLELGYIAVGAEQPRQALDYFAQALPMMTGDIEHPNNVPFMLIHAARARLQLGEIGQAHDTCLGAMQIARRIGNRRIEVLALNTLGQILTAQGRGAEAQTALQQAQSLNAGSGIKRDYPATALRLAQLASRQGNLAEALKQVELALADIDELRAAIPPGNDMRATYLASWNEAQTFQLDLLMQLHQQQPQAGYAARAFEAAESARARSLLELMLEASADVRQNLDPQLLARAEQLQREITSQPTASELTQLLAEYDWVKAQIHQNNARYTDLTPAPPLTLADVQMNLLDERTLLLAYAAGAERSWLFAVTPQSLHTFALPKRSELEELVRSYYRSLAELSQSRVFKSVTERKAWHQRHEQAQQTIAARLSQMLLAPAQALLPGKRLMIVPGTPLHHVPFAALPVVGKEPATIRQATGNRQPATDNQLPLIVNHEILTIPSVSMLAVLRRSNEKRAKAAKALAIFADPVFDSNDDRITRKSGDAAGNAATSSLAQQRLLLAREGGLRLSRLPAARREAESIAALVPETQRKLALDFAAARADLLKEDLRQYRYLHFATHGLFNNEHPELSALALSLVDQQGVAQDGYLRTMDVFNLKLNAELVVLSGCQTALGKEVNGEGLIGLSRGFMYAGARRVLASLWQVNDAATAELMKRFYQGMLGEEQLAPAAALRAAQLALLRDNRWQAPYYWAAFTLQGEW